MLTKRKEPKRTSSTFEPSLLLLGNHVHGHMKFPAHQSSSHAPITIRSCASHHACTRLDTHTHTHTHSRHSTHTLQTLNTQYPRTLSAPNLLSTHSLMSSARYWYISALTPHAQLEHHSSSILDTPSNIFAPNSLMRTQNHTPSFCTHHIFCAPTHTCAIRTTHPFFYINHASQHPHSTNSLSPGIPTCCSSIEDWCAFQKNNKSQLNQILPSLIYITHNWNRQTAQRPLAQKYQTNTEHVHASFKTTSAQ